MASVVALDPLHQAMRLVSYRWTAIASKTACKYGAFFIFLSCDPIIGEDGRGVTMMTMKLRFEQPSSPVVTSPPLISKISQWRVHVVHRSLQQLPVKAATADGPHWATTAALVIDNVGQHGDAHTAVG